MTTEHKSQQDYVKGLEEELITARERLKQLPLNEQALRQHTEELSKLRSEILAAQSEKITAQQQIKALEHVEATLRMKEQHNNELQQQLTKEHGKVNDLSARLENAEKQMEEKLQLLQEAKQQLKFEFQSVAQKLFEDKSERFTEQNKQNIHSLLNPLREQLVDFRKRVDDVYDRESKDRVSLYKEIVSLKDINQRMSEEALNLTRALKGDNKTQGNWGEMVLERILEESGLQKNREYFTQETFNSEAGSRLRPDVVVNLPDNKDVVIDSKVSLVGWERYCAANDEQAANDALQQLVTSIKAHIKGLGQKDYADLPGLRSLDFVLLFIPIEGAFLKALEVEPNLYTQAFEKNIMLVSPSTLLVTLRTVHNIWRYEYQNRNAEEIAKKAGALHDQFVLFSESLLDVGDKLEKAQAAYGTAYKRLVSGRGNLVGRTLQLEKLGAKAKKAIAKQLSEDNEQAEEEMGALPDSSIADDPDNFKDQSSLQLETTEVDKQNESAEADLLENSARNRIEDTV